MNKAMRNAVASVCSSQGKSRSVYLGISRLQTYVPGVLAAVVVAIVATFLSERYGGPVMLFALLLGMPFYSFHERGGASQGLSLPQSEFYGLPSVSLERKLRWRRF